MISPHFPPDTTAAAHRVRLVAPHLPTFGWKPTIVTVDARDYEGAQDPALAALVSADLDVVRCRAWPASWTRRIGVGDLGLRSFTGLWRAASALMASRSYDALFITIFPSYPALMGRWLKRRFNVPFVLDYQDPWVGSWGLTVGAGPGARPDIKSRLSRRVAEWLEPIALSSADAVTAVSARTYDDALARSGRAELPVRATLPLGWEARDLDAVDRVQNRWFDPRDGCVHLCYVGTLLPHGDAVLENLLGAVALLKSREPALYRRLRLWFIGTSNQTAGAVSPRVLPAAQRHAVDDVVTEIPLRIPYLDALRVLRDASAILLLGSTEPHYTASKLYPALMAQRPLFAMFHERSSVVSILREIGGPPSIRVIAFADALPDVETTYDELGALARRPVLDSPAIDLTAAQIYSARTIASRLAGVLDAVAGVTPLREAV
jgi:hypothetical protein